MSFPKLVYRVHALQRMFERKIHPDEVTLVLHSGKVIAEYPEDRPLASYLITGRGLERTLHIVAADDFKNQETVIITVYLPDPSLWEDDYQRRRQTL